jgi:hypothetical protein
MLDIPDDKLVGFIDIININVYTVIRRIMP